MRPTERIEPVLNSIRKLWYVYPDLRLCQLLSNVIPSDRDPYYIEDDELVEYIESYYDEHVTKL